MTATNNYVALILAGDTHASGRLFLTSKYSESKELPLNCTEVLERAIEGATAIERYSVVVIGSYAAVMLLIKSVRAMPTMADRDPSPRHPQLPRFMRKDEDSFEFSLRISFLSWQARSRLFSPQLTQTPACQSCPRPQEAKVSDFSPPPHDVMMNCNYCFLRSADSVQNRR